MFNGQDKVFDIGSNKDSCEFTELGMLGPQGRWSDVRLRDAFEFSGPTVREYVLRANVGREETNAVVAEVIVCGNERVRLENEELEQIIMSGKG